jgi:hypothetical protein
MGPSDRSAKDPEDVMAADRAQFVASAIGYWTAIHDGSAREANAQTDAGDRIVERWAAQGRLFDLLGGLLTDQSPQVRYAAAAHLLSTYPDVATPVLQELARDPQGMVAVTAKMLLMQRGISRDIREH